MVYSVKSKSSKGMAMTELVEVPVNGKVQMEASWKALLLEEFEKPYMKSLREFLRQEKQAGKTIYPKGAEIFSALNFTPFDQVKVVIIGQDPYHGPNQAHGLCFSVKPGIALPPSLKNIYKEINEELGIPPAQHGCLIDWAKQGVLLLNAVMTVESGKPASHQGKGWEQFTDKIIELINEKHRHVVFLLWGSYAQNKGAIIDTDKHLVLQSAHPSPFSVHRGFFGNGHFKKTNEYLQLHGHAPINWQLGPPPVFN
ncbi:MAG: Uracil-DNA glycosylase [Gammaproteobacteria bacterium]|jgi:uracil-DNA glycosylase|nr:Uracil-DNA glycosylase [Gammaproteobacteria bacterium]